MRLPFLEGFQAKGMFATRRSEYLTLGPRSLRVRNASL